MQLNDLLSNIQKTIKANSPEILTALGVSGVVTTAYLTAKASFKAGQVIQKEELQEGISWNANQRFKERTKLVWKLYIPAGVSGALTIVCIIGSTKTNARRTAAAVTAYSITERAFTEYKEKVVEQVGKGKEQKLRDEIAQSKVSEPAGSKEVVIVGGGQVLCCELYTMRYFRSDMEKLRRAENDLNAIIISQFYVALEEFYDLIGLPYTSVSGKMGWDSNKLVKLEFSTVLSPDGEPCIAFDYNYVKPIR